MRSAFGIRPACAEDLPRILILERATPEAPHWNVDVYRGYIAPPATAWQRKALWVAVGEDDLGGYAAAACTGQEAELESIVVANDTRRSGLGTRLLTACQAWARENGALFLLLEVRSGNAAAQAFYRSRGFVRAGVRPGYYKHPPDDALLLRLDLRTPINTEPHRAQSDKGGEL